MKYYIAGFLAFFLSYNPLAKGQSIDLSRAPEVIVNEKNNPYYARIDLGAALMKEDESSAATLAALGLGYQFNDLLRFDANLEYRFKNTINARSNTANNYQADVQSFDLMANAYIDLATIRNITPYIGLGLGVAQHNISTLHDINSLNTIAMHKNENWDFAFALHAGFAWHINQKTAIDFGYSYSDLGQIQNDSQFNINSQQSIEFEKIKLHNIKIGLRFNFQ